MRLIQRQWGSGEGKETTEPRSTNVSIWVRGQGPQDHMALSHSRF